ncbi:MAG: VTT domain-containing protein [Bacteroidota bacterium]
MKALIRFVVALGAFFTFTLLLFRVFDVLTVDDIRAWLEYAQTFSPWLIVAIIIGLMTIDLFIAIPTLSLTILAGFFLGVELGTVTAVAGMLCTGSLGYIMSNKYGERVLRKLTKEQNQREEMIRIFEKYGPVSLLLCRATPMLPELTSCLAGLTRMSFPKYLLFYLLGSVPYAIIACYAGSISSVENPQPAIFAFLGIFGVLGIIWFTFLHITRKKELKMKALNVKSE